MAGTFVVNGTDTTVTFAYTADTQKVSDTVNNAVAYLYPQIFGDVLDGNGDLIPFDQLTNQQKLNVLDDWLKKNVLDLAKEYNRKSAIRVAEVAAGLESETKYL